MSTMTAVGPITNTADVIDSREVIERIDTLRLEAESYYEERHPEADELPVLFDPADWLDEVDASEYRALVALQEEAEGAEDWAYGEMLIRDSYFEDYARDLAEDIGAVQADAPWPVYAIDWERAARDLQTDYSSVDFDGVTYWIRL